MKKYMLIVLLITISIVFLIAENQKIPPMVNYRDIHLKKPTHNYEIIEEYEFEKPLSTVYFTPPTLHDSGHISLAVLDANGPGKFYSFDENMNKKYLGTLIAHPISPRGKYFVDVRTEGKYPDFKKVYYTLYDNKGNKIWSISPKISNPGAEYISPSIGMINDNGDVTLSSSINELVVMKKDMTKTKKAGPFYNDKSLPTLVPAEYDIIGGLSNTGNFVIGATENRYLAAKYGSKYFYSFPLGSRFFFYDKDANLLKTYDIKGTNIPAPSRYSDSGRYFVTQNSGVLYVFRGTELIFQEDVKGLGYIYFSPDESLVLLGTGIGSLIMELPSGKIIDNFSMVGAAKAIANKGYPYVACADINELYVVNYRTGEVLLSEYTSTGYPRIDGINRVQLSGDGMMLTDIHNKWYRKYKIGGRK